MKYLKYLYTFYTCILVSQIKSVVPTDTLYVLAYIWSGEDCHKGEYPTCNNPDLFWRNHFTIHGLWPQYSTSGYPSFCSKEPLDTTIPNSIGINLMRTFWPNIHRTFDDPEYDEFWNHEWTKHGTCSGLNQLDYFNNTITKFLQLPTPSIVSTNVGKEIQAGVLRKMMGGIDYASLQCNDKKYLSGVFTCWSQVNHIPMSQVTCPIDVLKEDTCVEDYIHIPAYNSDQS